MFRDSVRTISFLFLSTFLLGMGGPIVGSTLIIYSVTLEDQLSYTRKISLSLSTEVDPFSCNSVVLLSVPYLSSISNKYKQVGPQRRIQFKFGRF